MPPRFLNSHLTSILCDSMPPRLCSSAHMRRCRHRHPGRRICIPHCACVVTRPPSVLPVQPAGPSRLPLDPSAAARCRRHSAAARMRPVHNRASSRLDVHKAACRSRSAAPRGNQRVPQPGSPGTSTSARTTHTAAAMQAATASRSAFAGSAVAHRAAGRRSAAAARQAVAVRASGRVANKQLLEVAQQAAAAGAKVRVVLGRGVAPQRAVGAAAVHVAATAPACSRCRTCRCSSEHAPAPCCAGSRPTASLLEAVAHQVHRTQLPLLGLPPPGCHGRG